MGGLLLSCGSPPEAKYDGMPLSVWVERLQSPVPEARQDALRVIASAGSAARRVEYFVLKLAREEENPNVKMEAVRTLEAMGAPVIEFEDFVKLYQGPIIPFEEDEVTMV
ncbi:MAG: HEAT repeat domain-containing protein, partial [Calditrichota bacterium]